MADCEICGHVVPQIGWRFCSRSCRAKHNGRNGWGATNQGHTKVCENCGTEFHVPASRLKTARACSRKCLGALQSVERTGTFQIGHENPGWKGGIQTYRRHRKDTCERCGSVDNLVVHHKDENRYNNKLGNLETLCRSCHAKEHDVGSWAPKGLRGPRTLFPKPCEHCGTEFKPRSQTHRFCSQACWLAVKNASPSRLSWRRFSR